MSFYVKELVLLGITLCKKSAVFRFVLHSIKLCSLKCLNFDALIMITC